MSRLIEQLRASDYPDKSQRDLTLEYGQWLEQNKRNDIFLANPDFSEEYAVLKDEIARARRPSYGEELSGAIGSASHDLLGSVYALGALGAHGAKSLGVPGAEPIRNNLLALMKDQQDESAQFQPSVPSYDKITNPGDLARYVTYGLGTVAPSMAQAAISGIAGAALGSAVGPEGTIGGALLGLAERRLAQKAVSALLEKGVKTVTLEQAAKAIPRELIAAEAKRLAIQYGGQAALAASSVGQEIGSIYADNPEAPGAAIGYGIPAGLLDVLPEAYIASKFLGAGKRVAEEEVKKSVGYFRRFATEAAKLVPMEGSTEAAQTLLEIAAAKSGRGESPTSFTDADYRQMLNAGIIGAIGGLGMAPVAAFGNPDARPDPTARIGETVASRLPLGEASAGQPPMEFGGEIPEQDLIGRRTLSPATQGAIAAEERVGFEGFNPEDMAPFTGAGQTGVPASPPKAVLRAVENANEAAQAWEVAHATTEPFPGETALAPLGPLELPAASLPAAPSEMEHLRPQSEVITDAPLANLIGTTVQYSGYTGILIRDREGNFLVQREVGDTRPVEVSGTGKDPSVMGSAVGVVPTEPPNMTPKTPEAIGTTGGDRGAPAPSKVPLAPLFPNTLPPVAGLRGDVQGAPSGPLLAQQGFPQAQLPAAVAPSPVVAPAPAAPPVVAPVVPPVAPPVAPPVPVIAPTGVVTQPTGEQVIAVGENGVKAMPAESAPNLRRLQVFTQAAPAPVVEVIEGPAPVSAKPVEAGAIGPNPMVELAKRVKKVAKKDSNVAVVIVDNATGLAYQRLAYGGPANTVYVDMASARGPVKKAYGTIQGSTTSPTADFVNGTEGRPISGSRGVFTEKLPDGTPRYTIYGIGELIKPGKLGNWNLGNVANLAAHPGIAEAAQLGWTENAKAINAKAATALSKAQDITKFVEEMAVWRGENKGAKGAKAMLAHIEAWAAADQKRNVGARKPTPQQMADYVELIRGNIDVIAKVQETQRTRISADYVAPTASVIDLFKSTLRALTEGRDVDVAAFEQGLMGAVDSAAKTTGLVITPAGRRKIVAFAASAINGPIDPAQIISLLHETGHVVTDGLSEPLRVAFQESITQMPWQARERGEFQFMTAFHGTPHVVDEFSTSRIGTGEGAASYGWGLYFAELKKVAEGYRANLSAAMAPPMSALREYFKPGNTVGYGSQLDRVKAFHEGKDGRWSVEVQGIYRRSDGSTELGRVREHMTTPSNADFERAGVTFPKGNLYSVDIADETVAKMLDWDKPLSEQSDAVKRAIAPFFDAYYAKFQEENRTFAQRKEGWGDLKDTPYTEPTKEELMARKKGAEFYGDLQGTAHYAVENPARFASEALLKAGIPGIKYLDEGSRDKGATVESWNGKWKVGFTAGGGFNEHFYDTKEAAQRFADGINGSRTRNFVVFDGKTAKILTENGMTRSSPQTKASPDIRFTQRADTGWLLNPRSLDIRLIANAEPSQLSFEQRAALETLTAEEVAAARRIDPALLAEEQMAEHLAQLGWDKSEAKGVVQALVRFVKELWLKMAMAIQTALKGQDNLSPALARAYVENRFLQFIHRDSALASDRINDLMTWLGAPATESQKIPVFPAGPDWDQRMQFIDVATGEIIPTKTANYTPDSQAREIKLALDRAAQWVAQNPTATTPDTPALRFTQRGFFGAPFSSTPTITANKIFANVNLVAEVLRGVAAHESVAPLLPQIDGAPPTAERFATEWLKLPPEQTPQALKQAALAGAQQPDPLTGQPIAHDPEMTIDALPTVEQKIVDREGKPKVVTITEAQDDAIEQAIFALRDAERRVIAQATRDNERVDELTREKERAARTKGDFTSVQQYALSRLSEEVLTRQKIALRLHVEINALLAKFRPGDIVQVYPGAELLTVPADDATEEQIRGGRKYRIPLDMTFATANMRSELGTQIAQGEAWLKNPDNRAQGQIYGIISEQVRKLRQIPLNQERSMVSVLLRKISGGFIDALNASGLPSLRYMAKRFAGATAFVGQYRSELTTLGNKWETAFAGFAKAMGRPNDQAFVEEIWDPLSRVWNYIDSSERGKLGTPDDASIFAVLERALKAHSGVEVTTEAQRSALRTLTMQTIETERYFGQMFDHHPELQVHDKALGTYRRLRTHGLVTGRRGLARHMESLGLQMNPEWSDTKGIADGDVRSFWEAAGELYGSDRAAFDARMKTLFDGYVVEDFVAPLATNNVALFDVAGSDGEPRRASVMNVRQAWSEAEGDVTKFAEILHRLEGAGEGMEGQTVGLVLGNLQERFGRLKGILDKQAGARNTGVETLQRQMLDGREANDLPAQWVSYATMDSTSNLVLLHQLAMQSAFGPQAQDGAKADVMGDRRSARGADPIAAGSELFESIYAARRELLQFQDRLNTLQRDGLSPAQIKAEMGPDDYGIATTADRSIANLNYVKTVFEQLHSVTNYLNTDLKTANEVLGFMSTMMLQNPRSGILQMADILGMIVDLKASTQTLKGLRDATKSAASDIANSVIESFNQQAAFAVPAAQRLEAAGVIDSETRVSWNEKTAGQGPRSMLAKPVGFETWGTRLARTVTRLSRRGREIVPNIGSPLSTPGEERLAPKLTAGLFHTITNAAMRASANAAHDMFADIVTRGVAYLQRIPVAERAQFVRELELGVRDLGADELGYTGGYLLNDKGAFLNLKAALETQMVGEKSVGDFVAKGYRRMEASAREADAGRGNGAWEAISNSQFVDVIAYVNNQWTLNANFATLPAFMQGPMRPLFIFLTWPYLAMRRAARGFTDAQQRMTWAGANSSVADGMKAFFILAAPATIAASFAVDWYDKYLLGKRQNLREAPLSTAIPVVGALLHPQAFVERWARYGSAGLPSEIVNMAVNYDSQKTLSLDTRVVAISAIQNIFDTLIKTPISQEMNLTYGTFGRPLLQAVGAGGVLQYLQVAQNLLGLDTQDAAINARINTGNYLRAAGHELNLPVRVFAGPSFTPTPVTPYLQQMELAALVNNQTLFREAYRAAVQAERDEGHKDDAEKRVADNFATRHPLRRLFKGVVTEGDYRKMLGEMDEYGATQVRAAVNSYNRFMGNWFGRKPYYGKADSGGESVEQLIRRATQINSGFEREDSLLALPR